MEYMEYIFNEENSPNLEMQKTTFVNLTAQPYTEEMARNHNQFDSIRLQFPEGESVKLFNILGKLYQKTYLTYQEAQVTFLVTSGVCHRGPVSSWPIQFIY